MKTVRSVRGVITGTSGRHRLPAMVATAAMVSLSAVGCAPYYVFDPADIGGTVVSAVSGEPVSGARVSYESRFRGLPIADAPVVVTDANGEFQSGGRELRAELGFGINGPSESSPPVVLRIDADGYETRRIDVAGNERFSEPIELAPLDRAQ